MKCKWGEIFYRTISMNYVDLLINYIQFEYVYTLFFKTYKKYYYTRKYIQRTVRIAIIMIKVVRIF